MMALSGVEHRDATRCNPLATGLELASVWPQTRTNAICMENPSSDHAPSPQWPTMAIKFWPVTIIPATNVINVNRTAKRKASGRKRCITNTQILVIRLIIASPDIRNVAKVG